MISRWAADALAACPGGSPACYDRAYGAAAGDPGLLVHGPLQALLMAGHAEVEVPYRFAYRLTAPLHDDQGLVVGGPPDALYVRDHAGRRTASAAFTPG